MFIRMHTAPFGNLLDLEREIDSLFSRVEDRVPAQTAGRCPALDVAEYADESVVVAELPGVRKEDLKISVQDGLLTISGERKGTEIPGEARWVRSEIGRSSFRRVLQLPHAVNQDAVTASLSDGLLRIVLPKADEARPREISVK